MQASMQQGRESGIMMVQCTVDDQGSEAAVLRVEGRRGRSQGLLGQKCGDHLRAGVGDQGGERVVAAIAGLDERQARQSLSSYGQPEARARRDADGGVTASGAAVGRGWAGTSRGCSWREAGQSPTSGPANQAWNGGDRKPSLFDSTMSSNAMRATQASLAALVRQLPFYWAGSRVQSGRKP